MNTRIGPALAERVRAAWTALLDAVANGDNIGDACAAAGLKREHVTAYRLDNPEADREWQAAREQSADAFADKVAAVAENDKVDPAFARVRMDAYRWLAAKRNPRVYSDKQTIDMNVRTVDLTRIIDSANARLAAARVIEGAVIRPLLESAKVDVKDLL
jgi:hypothetical protein